jgi:hypothetical protein
VVCVLFLSVPAPNSQAESIDDLYFYLPDPSIDESAPNHSPFEIDLSVDLPIILTGVLVGGAPKYMDIDIGRDLSGLDAGSINSLDRTVLGNWSGTADMVSETVCLDSPRTRLFLSRS